MDRRAILTLRLASAAMPTAGLRARVDGLLSRP